ncbi:MAG: hypothetical protein M3Y36_03255 [Actinomycetota bacterium]|nr:hypothetical protein [Actinomycetota bacterium]
MRLLRQGPFAHLFAGSALNASAPGPPSSPCGVKPLYVRTVLHRSPALLGLSTQRPADAQGRILVLAAAAEGAGSLATIPLAGLAVDLIGVSGTGAVVGGPPS